MKIQIEIFTFMLRLIISFLFTKWYLPIHIKWTRYYSTGMFELSILWTVHLTIRFPLPLVGAKSNH